MIDTSIKHNLVGKINNEQEDNFSFSIVYVVFFIGIALSLLMFNQLEKIEDRKLNETSKKVSEDLTTIIREQLRSTTEAIESIAALYSASVFVDRFEFANFVNHKTSHKIGIQAIEWVPRIKASRRAETERLARNDGYKNFHFMQQNADGEMVIASDREEYFPVFYVEPYQGNEAALGFDLGSSPSRRMAMEQAMESGQLQATGRISLVQETGNQYGVLVFQPIYRQENSLNTAAERRQQLLGFALGVLRMSDVIEKGLNKKTSNHTVYVFDLSAPTNEQLIYPAQSIYQSYDEIDQNLCYSTPFIMGQRSWQIAHCNLDSHSSYFTLHFSSVLALLGGLIITILLTLFFRAILNKRLVTHQLMSQLTHREERIHQILDNVEDAILTSDNSGMIQSANRAASRMFGYSAIEFEKKQINSLVFIRDNVNEEKKVNFISLWDAALTQDYRKEFKARHKDGAEIPVEMTVTRHEQILIAVFADIGHRKEIERIEQKSNERFRQFFDVTIESIFFHRHGLITDVNPSGAELVGLRPRQVIGHSLLEYIPQEFHSIVMEKMQNPQDILWESEVLHQDGRRIPVEIQSSDSTYQGEKIRVLAIRNISDRKEAESVARNLATELSQLINYANAPIFGTDVDGLINEWNRAAERVTGYSKTEAMGEHLVEKFIPIEQTESVRRVFESALIGEETENFEFYLVAKSGETVTLLLNSSPRRNIDGKIIGVIGMAQNITERKKAEAQVIQASKLATLGEMATSVAHELNQPLNVIRMASENVIRKLNKGSMDKEYLQAKLQRISAQTERAAAIIDHMRMFGRKALEPPSLLDPREMVLGALALVGEQLRLSEITIETSLPKDCSMITGHKVQVEQVLLNLLTNARDAILEVENNPSKWIKLEVVDESGDALKIIVSDSGGGIPDKMIGRIFEPFYTTKEMGKGTGLGLSVSYGIIHDMGGSIEATNLQHGACFEITLPKAETPVLIGHNGD